MSEPTGVAYLTHGRLIVRVDGRPAFDVDSAFARGVADRQARAHAVHGWKESSGSWGAMGFAPPELAQWEMAEQRRLVSFRGVAAGDDAGTLYYLLGVGDMGGLFQYTIEDGAERRLMHRNGFQAKDLTRRSGGGEIAVSSSREDGTIGILIGENDGRFLRDVTAGDSIDESPAWVPGDARRLVYQSAAIGRDAQGLSVGSSPYRIEQIDVDAKKIETVHEK